MRNRHPSIDSRILKVSSPARALLYLAVFAGFLAVVCVVAQSFLLSDVVSRVFQKGQTLNDVAALLGAMLVIALIRAAFIWCGDVLAQRSANHLKTSLRETLTRHLFALGPAFTRKERTGELATSLVEGVEILDEYMTVYQPARNLAVFVPVFVSFVMFLLDPLTLPVLLFTGPILVILLAIIGSRTKEITERRFLELRWMSAFFLDMLQGIATLKMFGRSREQIETIREISDHYGSTTMEVLRTAFQTSLVLEWGGTIATAFVAVEVSLRLMSGTMPFEQALAVLIITPEFFLPLRQLATRYHAGRAGKAAAVRIFEILDTPAPQSRTQTTNVTVPQRMDIHFNDVHFAYDNGKRMALQGFTLHIAHGTTMALVGATGAGKTTVAQLLLQFITADDGVIMVGDVPLSEIAAAGWRSKVAWVPQLPHLFHGSVADNIRLARPSATQDEIITAAKNAHAHEFILSLPHGYDTPLGEKGARLSGGQQQRIAIARAFLKDTPLLILDEATSHLDSSSEAAIQEALARLMKDRTSLIIAHRLKLVYKADHVAVVEHGRVIEVGDPNLLLAQSGPYQRLVKLYESGAA